MRVMLSIAITVGLLSAEAVHAQEVQPTDSTMVVAFDRLDDIDPPAKSPRELTLGHVSAMVDGRECAEHRFTNDTGVLVIGLPEQAEPCRQAGATVVLVNANGLQVGPVLTFEPGTRYRVTNYAPPPTDSGAAPNPASDAPMLILLTSEDEAITVAQFMHEEITALSGDAVCLTQSITAGEDEVLVVVGSAEQPPACRIPGAGLTLVNGAGQHLWDMVEFVPGTTVPFTNFAPLPGAANPIRPPENHVDPVPAGEGVHLVTWRIGTLSQALAAVDGLISLWVSRNGDFVGYIAGAPNFANERFLAEFPHDVLPAGTLLAAVVSEAPWSASDFLAVLAARDIEVAPTGRTASCGMVDGVVGTEYSGDSDFVLWVYPDAESVANEWHVAHSTARHHVFECNRAPARIFVQDNLVLWTPAPAEREIGHLLFNVTGTPAPADIHMFALVPPAEGTPYGGQELMDALSARGFSAAPYERPGVGTAATLQGYAVLPPAKGAVSSTAELWVYPTEEALRSEWLLGSDGTACEAGVHDLRFVDECEPSGRTIYHAGNLLLVLHGSWDTDSREQVVDAFRSLKL